MATETVSGTQKAAAVRYAADQVRDALHALADSLEGAQPDFLTAKEAAAVLRLSPQTVWDMCKDGRLPSQKVGRRVLIPAEAVREIAS